MIRPRPLGAGRRRRPSGVAQLGQGASLAAESAVQVARCLRDPPFDQAFVAYERLRRDRVADRPRSLFIERGLDLKHCDRSTSVNV